MQRILPRYRFGCHVRPSKAQQEASDDAARDVGQKTGINYNYYAARDVGQKTGSSRKISPV